MIFLFCFKHSGTQKDPITGSYISKKVHFSLHFWISKQKETAMENKVKNEDDSSQMHMDSRLHNSLAL